jgi:hypothetical protein
MLVSVIAPLMVLSVVLLALGWSTDVPVGWGMRGFGSLLALTFSAVGLTVALNRPNNAIGWVFLGLGLLAVVQALGFEYAHYGFLTRNDPLPGTLVFAWIANWAWIPLVGLMAVGLFMLFPDGKFQSRKWRNVGIVSIGICAMLTVALALEPGSLKSSAPYLNSPYSLGFFDDATVRLMFLLMFVLTAAATSQIVRFRNAGPEVRQQVKWLATVSVLAAVSLSLNVTQQKVFEYVTVFIIVTVPLAAGIAILRYRLYDIDVIINRALVYGGLTATLAVVYFSTVVVLQLAFRSVTGQESNLALVVSTLTIALLFQPVRRRVQSVIDRRLYRNRYDAAQTLHAFSMTARDEVDLERLAGTLVGVVNDTFRPAHTSLWLRQESPIRIREE